MICKPSGLIFLSFHLRTVRLFTWKPLYISSCICFMPSSGLDFFFHSRTGVRLFTQLLGLLHAFCVWCSSVWTSIFHLTPRAVIHVEAFAFYPHRAVGYRKPWVLVFSALVRLFTRSPLGFRMAQARRDCDLSSHQRGNHEEVSQAPKGWRRFVRTPKLDWTKILIFSVDPANSCNCPHLLNL